jgi:hypothetical protein
LKVIRRFGEIYRLHLQGRTNRARYQRESRSQVDRQTVLVDDFKRNVSGSSGVDIEARIYITNLRPTVVSTKGTCSSPASSSCSDSAQELGKYLDEYEEEKAELVKKPRLQLKLLLKDKLSQDGIRLSCQPYSTSTELLYRTVCLMELLQIPFEETTVGHVQIRHINAPTTRCILFQVAFPHCLSARHMLPRFVRH